MGDDSPRSQSLISLVNTISAAVPKVRVPRAPAPAKPPIPSIIDLGKRVVNTILRRDRGRE
jgi:hypothetical protein